MRGRECCTSIFWELLERMSEGESHTWKETLKRRVREREKETGSKEGTRLGA